MHERQEVLCEQWSEEQVKAKPHSRLYHLEPIGMGSPMVESLTSYIARLAETHCVYPHTLITREIASLLEQISVDTSRKANGALNGSTTIMTDIVRALELLTMRHDLRFLTMSTWRQVLSHTRLLRNLRAWCPVCLEEWQETKNVLYEPLLWKIDVVRVCHLHRLPLQTQCPHPACNHIQPPVPHYTLIGYCSRCKGWLGSPPEHKTARFGIPDETTWEQQLWIADSIGKMFSAAPFLSTLPQRDRLIATIDKYAERLTGGKRATLIRQLHCNWPTISNWLYNDQTPPLGHLLHFCYQLGTSPLQLFQCEIEESTIAKYQTKGKPKRHRREFDSEKTRRELEAILLSTEKTSPSLEEVARQLGFNPRHLRDHFPELCRAIAAKYKASPTFTEKVRVVEGISEIKTIEKHLRRFDPETIRKELESFMLIEETMPPSLKEIAAQIGYPPSKLRKHFPELCRTISSRYMEALAVRKEQRIQTMCDEVRKAIFKFHEEGYYPSMSRIERQIKRPGAFFIPEVKAAWRETMKELGWQ